MRLEDVTIFRDGDGPFLIDPAEVEQADAPVAIDKDDPGAYLRMIGVPSFEHARTVLFGLGIADREEDWSHDVWIVDDGLTVLLIVWWPSMGSLIRYDDRRE